MIFLLVVQEAFVDMLVNRDLVQATPSYSILERSRRFAALLCISEMCVFGIGTFFVFHWRKYAKAHLKGDIEKVVGSDISAHGLAWYCVKDILVFWDLRGKGCPHPKPLDTVDTSTGTLVPADPTTNTTFQQEVFSGNEQEPAADGGLQLKELEDDKTQGN